MKRRPSSMLCVIAITIATLLGACSKPEEAHPPAVVSAASAPAAVAHPIEIAWTQAANDADVDRAFARARAESKPVFVYWGAKWCPPCNQVKATLFNRADFIERSRAFVPVYIDGDSPGAQKLGDRFAVRGYPTLLLFNAAGTELTRLPGEVDPGQYTQLLTLGMNAQRPVKAVLADARAGGRGLAPNDWRLLAFYSWETDEQQVAAKAEVPALLRQLAAACPADLAETATRLWLKALAVADPKRAASVDETTRKHVLDVLADATRSRAHMDVLTNNAVDLVKTTSVAGAPERARLQAAMDTRLAALAGDAALSRADRLTALVAQVDLARIDAPEEGSKVALPEALLARIRAQVARDDREISDGYERQAVITTAAYLLDEAGLADESDTLLEANLAKSHSPYYLMAELASNAKKRGDASGSLRWREQAFNSAEGAATRQQWGAAYVEALVAMAPQDSVRIEAAVKQLFSEAATQGDDAFHGRSARSLQRVGAALLTWRKAPSHEAAFARLRAELDGLCARLPSGDAQRGVCEAVLKPAARAKAA